MGQAARKSCRQKLFSSLQHTYAVWVPLRRLHSEYHGVHWSKSSHSVNLSTHLHPPQMLRMGGDVTLLHIHLHARVPSYAQRPYIYWNKKDDTTDTQTEHVHRLSDGTNALLKLTLIICPLFCSGSQPTCDNTLIPDVFCERSARDNVILRWVKDSVEWGRNVSLVRNTAWPCRPVPWRMNRWLWSPCDKKHFLSIKVHSKIWHNSLMINRKHVITCTVHIEANTADCELIEHTHNRNIGLYWIKIKDKLTQIKERK